MLCEDFCKKYRNERGVTMEMLLKLIEACAVAGANCASLMLAYQPKMPECLK